MVFYSQTLLKVYNAQIFSTIKLFNNHIIVILIDFSSVFLHIVSAHPPHASEMSRNLDANDAGPHLDASICRLQCQPVVSKSKSNTSAVLSKAF